MPAIRGVVRLLVLSQASPGDRTALDACNNNNNRVNHVDRSEKRDNQEKSCVGKSKESEKKIAEETLRYADIHPTRCMMHPRSRNIIIHQYRYRSPRTLA